MNTTWLVFFCPFWVIARLGVFFNFIHFFFTEKVWHFLPSAFLIQLCQRKGDVGWCCFSNVREVTKIHLTCGIMRRKCFCIVDFSNSWDQIQSGKGKLVSYKEGILTTQFLICEVLKGYKEGLWRSFLFACFYASFFLSKYLINGVCCTLYKLYYLFSLACLNMTVCHCA